MHQDHDLLVCIIPILPIATLAKLNELESDVEGRRHVVDKTREIERGGRLSWLLIYISSTKPYSVSGKVLAGCLGRAIPFW